MVVLAVAVLAALLLTQLYAPIPAKNPNPQPTPFGSRSIPYYQEYGLDLVRMTSSTTGWARGGLRTTDGGKTWRDVSPPTLPGNPDRHLEFYLDADHGWQGQIFPDRLVLFRTADGGKSWEQAAPVHVAAKNPVGLYGLLSFVDAQRGWLLTESWPEGDPHPDPTASGLYRTTDGGLHWALLLSDPGSIAAGCYFSQGLAFATPSIGWIELICPQAPMGTFRIMATLDGGATWELDVANSGLCAPCASSSLPTVIDAQHWMLPTSDAIYVTEDGGKTWDLRDLPGSDLRPPPLQKGGRLASVSFIDPNIGWAFVWLDAQTVPANTSRLYRTTDGGRTWTLIHGNLTAQPPDAASVVFVDASTGFAIHRISNSWVQLLKTVDGGQSWTEIHYQLPSPAET